jgi:predicted transcriptional regulator
MGSEKIHLIRQIRVIRGASNRQNSADCRLRLRLRTCQGRPPLLGNLRGHVYQFALTWWQRIFIHVSQKEIVLDAISELPDEVSLQEIAEKIEFLAAIQKGMDQLDRGEGIPHEEVKRQLATWLAS